MILGIAAIFKNEHPYIIEWLAFHRLMGFDRFYIADNESDDGSSELLSALHHAGLITCLRFPTPKDSAPQLPAYNRLLNTYGRELDWLAFIDADEFIVPEPGWSVRDVLAPLSKDPQVGAIGMNWAVFGSSGQQKAGPELVTERFTQRALKSLGVNRHIKTLVKPGSCRFMKNPHKAALNNGQYVYADGTEMVFDAKHPEGMSARVSWDRLRVNHYVIKSYEEFKNRKQPRGRATTNVQRLDEFFSQHDLNDEACDWLKPWLPALSKEVDSILATLARHKGGSGLLPWLGRRGARLWSKVAPSPLFELQPVSHLLRVGGKYQWRVVGEDPGFRLKPLGGFREGWFMLSAQLQSSLARLEAKLYVDYGSGFVEAQAIVLPLTSGKLAKRVVYFKNKPLSIRFDPVEQVCFLSVEHFSLKRLTPGFARKLMHKKLTARGIAVNQGCSDRQWLQLYEQCFQPAGPRMSYDQWRSVHESPPLSAGEAAAIIASLPFRPVISVVMATYNISDAYLIAAIESVVGQSYPQWELCIADDASTAGHVRPLLEQYSKKDHRIKVCFREQNGHISAASNSALALVSGDYVGLLDHDDCLAPDALLSVVQTLNRQRSARVIYSDEDKIDESGQRSEPHFKPDWNRDLFYSHNYICHFTVLETSLIRAVGGFRTGVEGSQDYDLLLRCIAKVKDDEIVHIPSILYHWRAIQGSTALSGSEKRYTQKAGVAALKNFFEPVGRGILVDEHQLNNCYRVRWPVPEPKPLVSLIIPTRDGYEVLKQCVDSIYRLTRYPNFEVLIVNNQSCCPKTLAYFNELKENRLASIIDFDDEFNFSAMNNMAVNQARGSIVGLINNDIEILNEDWLEEMVSQAARPDIGCVGAKLYYPDGRIQHAGVILGIGGIAGHSHKYFGKQHYGYHSRLSLVQNYSAVTAAALLVRKDVYLEVGGLEPELKVAFNDVDFCLKVRDAGYRNLWTPFAEMIHHESVSRGFEDTPEKKARFSTEITWMQNRWGDKLQRDPCYNPNLTLTHEDFSFRAV
ncbi:glycosyltransferase [Shewanella sp. JM162201]|uniref:Glycosyltransferase n=1 Tax=Shewanella jiangmenensis TaxID=2837387 RepID=A0ABS5V4G8_9GAMM|nr:glycosyltransferase [Shewanella jiangmenensis]MBT1445356.1 glycosyltransferase [Shewanella jiangmenensis]